MDVHKEAIVLAVMNGEGKVVMESIIETKASTTSCFLSVSGAGGVLFACRSPPIPPIDPLACCLGFSPDLVSYGRSDGEFHRERT